MYIFIQKIVYDKYHFNLPQYYRFYRGRGGGGGHFILKNHLEKYRDLLVAN